VRHGVRTVRPRDVSLHAALLARRVQPLTLSVTVLHASTPKLVPLHPRCHTIDPLPFMTKFPASSHQPDCPSLSFNATRCTRPLASRASAKTTSMLRRTFTVYRIDQSLISYVSLISSCRRPPALYSRNSPSTSALLSFRTPHILCPSLRCIHRHALDYDFSRPLLISGAVPPCHRCRAGLSPASPLSHYVLSLSSL